MALKGNNRADFVRILRRNINRGLHGLGHSIILSEGRFIVSSDGAPEEVGLRLGRIFGISWYASVESVSEEYPAILEAALRAARDSPGRTFKIAPRRSDKSFPLTSQDLAVRLGDEIARATGMSVDLSEPDVTIHADVIRGGALVYTDKQKGLGGLPVGTAGRAIHLFSGGIDSPVAAWLLMKRGTRPIYLHFYLAPTPLSAFESKITRLVRVLSSYGGRSTLVLCPFADYQLGTTGVPAELEPSLFRRFMRMVAEVLAPRFDAAAISTGDSLSQAASQTIWNMASFDTESSLPILRPLLTYDKEEIVSLARRIGTYELSLEEYKDCCAMITTHPRTKLRADVVTEYVRRYDLNNLAMTLADKATLATYNPASANMKLAPLVDLLPRVRSG